MSKKKGLDNVYVIAYGRSAVAKAGKKGALRNSHPVDYAGLVLKGLLKKNPSVPREQIEDVVVGCSFPEGAMGFNIARLIAARAGLAHEVCGVTVNRFCSSGLQSIGFAAAMIEAGQCELLVAGGVESMTAVGINVDSNDFSPWLVENDPSQYMSMGLTAENVAAWYGVTRAQMDRVAVESHAKALAAINAGKFKEEIIPVPGVDSDGNCIVFSQDQGVRPGTSMESIAQLKPCFLENGTVTAATSSQTSDGAGFVILASGDKARELGLNPVAKFRGLAVAGCDPEVMGLGPIYAVPKALALTGLALDDMDVIELNEAFAAQVIPCIENLQMDKNKVNPNGGALALGHPLGATGTILTCKALSELKRRDGKYAMVTMCIGGGMGAAGIFERISGGGAL